MNIHLSSVSSTNDFARKHYREWDPNELTCISADCQSEGRGRRNRRWVSPHGENIYATFYFRIPTAAPYINNLGQIMALSAASVLQKESVPVQIKWPNDLVMHGKKLGGILCESIPESEYINIFLGIGLNVNSGQEDLLGIDQPVTSLKIETKCSWDHKKLLQAVEKEFKKNLSLLETEGFSAFSQSLEACLAYKGEKIRFFDGKTVQEGICHSITLDGRLNIITSDDKLLTFASGDITTRIPPDDLSQVLET